MNRKNRKLSLIRLRCLCRAARAAQDDFLRRHDETPEGERWAPGTVSAKAEAERLSRLVTGLFHATASMCGTVAAVRAVNR
jgi:hypothetical protein